MIRHALPTLGCIFALATITALEVARPVALAQAVERPTVTVEVHGGGFHWADAAIGGGVVAGAAIAAAGVVLAVRRPNHQPPDWRSHD